MGEHTLPIPMSLHSLNRRRMVKKLSENEVSPQPRLPLLPSPSPFLSHIQSILTPPHLLSLPSTSPFLSPSSLVTIPLSLPIPIFSQYYTPSHLLLLPSPSPFLSLPIPIFSQYYTPSHLLLLQSPSPFLSPSSVNTISLPIFSHYLLPSYPPGSQERNRHSSGRRIFRTFLQRCRRHCFQTGTHVLSALYLVISYLYVVYALSIPLLSTVYTHFIYLLYLLYTLLIK